MELDGPLLEEKGNEAPESQGQYTCNEAMEHAGFGRFQIVLGLLCGALFSTDAIQALLGR